MQQLFLKIQKFIKQSLLHQILFFGVIFVAVVGSGFLIKEVAFQTSGETTVAKAKPVKKKIKKKLKTVNWKKPSENKDYPRVYTADDVILSVDLKKQRVYVKSKENGEILYTMYASSGMKNSTPKGEFEMEDERGSDFYNPDEKMGARYYSSFYDHGTYLFHTVPTDINGKYIKKEANLLGKRPSSHGCIRLTIPDAKWIRDWVPSGTKVYVY